MFWRLSADFCNHPRVLECTSRVLRFRGDYNVQKCDVLEFLLVSSLLYRITCPIYHSENAYSAFLVSDITLGGGLTRYLNLVQD